MMKEITVTAHIEAPCDEVFSYVVDPRKSFLTNNPVTHMEVVGEQMAGVGTIYQWTFTLPLGLTFKFDEVVTEWIEPRQLAYRAVSGWEMEALAILTPDNEGTQEKFTLYYRAPGLWNWLIPSWLVRLGIRHALANIRKAVTEESNPES